MRPLSEDQKRYYRELDDDVWQGYLDSLLEGRDGAVRYGAVEAAEEYQEAIDQLIDARFSRPLPSPSMDAGL